MKFNRILASAFACALAACTAPHNATTLSGTAIKGRLTGFTDVRNNDDKLDGALIVPSMRAEDLITLRLDSLMSPSEAMSAGPATIRVPGNVYFPNQTEHYGFFSVNIKKETFTNYLQPGTNNELVAIAFRAPFSRLVDMGQNHAPVIDMLAEASVRQFGMGADQDWTALPQPVSLALGAGPNRNTSYVWPRGPRASNERDLALSFQKTPANRWLVSDFAVTGNQSGSIGALPGLTNTLRAAFVRVKIPTDTNDQIPLAASGYFVNATAGQPITVNGVPQGIQNATLDASRASISWSPINSQGWVAVLRETNGGSAPAAFAKKFLSPLLFPGFGDLDYGAAGFAATIESWVNPTSGTYNFEAPVAAGAKAALVFVGTDSEVPAPTTERITDMDPPIFTHATEFRFVRLN